MRFTTLLAGTVAVHALLATAAGAQTPRPRSDDDRNDRPTRVFARDDSDRAVLGVNTASSSSERDTLGVLITSITPGGPAEKAGLEEGNRIAAVNNVNLRLAPADAGEPDMRGMAARRLSREMQKVKPGGDVELRVYANGAFKTVRVKTVAADELPGRRMRLTRAERRDEWENRAVLGLGLGGGGSRRDTLGILITRVESDGPAEKAGIVEGDRVMAINGVDLRVSPQDAGDEWVSNAKANRFRRTMRDVKAGNRVELRVYSGGQTKTVPVTAVRAGDLYKDEHGGMFHFGDIGEALIPPMPPMPPHPPMPPEPPLPAMAPLVHIAPRIRIAPYVDEYTEDFHDDDMDVDFDLDFDVDLQALEDLGEELGDVGARAGEAVRRAFEGSRAAFNGALDDAADARDAAADAAEAAREAAAEELRARRDARREMQRELRREMQRQRDEIERQRRDGSVRAASLDDMTFLVDPAPLAALADGATQLADGALTLAGGALASPGDLGDIIVEGAGPDEGFGWGSGWGDGEGGGDGAVMTASGHGSSYTLRLPGLRLTKVTPDLASTLGRGSESGLLVLEASDAWDDLRAGDVLLAVDGTPVRRGDRAAIRFDRGHDSRATVLRKGKRVEVSVEAWK